MYVRAKRKIKLEWILWKKYIGSQINSQILSGICNTENLWEICRKFTSVLGNFSKFSSAFGLGKISKNFLVLGKFPIQISILIFHSAWFFSVFYKQKTFMTKIRWIASNANFWTSKFFEWENEFINKAKKNTGN